MTASQMAGLAEPKSVSPHGGVRVAQGEPLKVVTKQPVLLRAQIRALREVHQRKCARSRYAEARRLVPKVSREKKIALDRRVSAEMKTWTYLCDEDHYGVNVVQQSGLSDAGLACMAGLTVAAAAYGIYSLGSAAYRTSKSATELSDSIGGFLRTVTEKLEEFCAMAKRTVGLWWTVPVLLLCFAIFKEYAHIALLASGLGVLYAKLFKEHWQHLSQYFQPVVQQDGEQGSLLALLVTGACICIMPGIKTTAGMADVVMRRVGSFDRTLDGFKSIFRYGAQLIERVVNAVLGLFSIEEISFTDKSEKLMRKWMLAVDDFEKKCIVGNPSLPELQHALDLMRDGIGFRQVLRVPTSIITCNKYLERLGLMLQAHKGALDASNSFRQQTLFCLFGGESAVGKSSVLKNFGTLALLEAGEVTAAEAMSNLWQKGTSEYWNGYVGQKCLILDDCFQAKPVAGQDDTEYMHIIRAVGNWAFPLNFADIESKGRFYFNSPLMIGTTNVKNVQELAGTVVNCPAAVVRRVQYGYWLEVSPEWRVNGKLDYARLEREYKNRMDALLPGATKADIIACYPWEAWRAFPHDFQSEPVTAGREPVSLVSILQEVANDLKNRKQSHETSTENLSRWLTLAEQAWKDENAQLEREVVPQSGLTSFTLFDQDLTPTSQDVTAHALAYCRSELSGGVSSHHEDSDDDSVISEAPSAYSALVASTHVVVGETPVEFADRMLEQRMEISSSHDGGLKRFIDAIGKAIGTVVKTITKFIDPAEDEDEIESDPKLTMFSHLTQRLRPLWRILGRATLLVVAVFAAIKLAQVAATFLLDTFKTLFPGGFRKPRGGPEEQSNIKEKPVAVKQRTVTFRSVAGAQLGSPPADVLQDHIYANTYKILVGSAPDDENMKTVGQLQFLVSTMAVMPSHFRKQLENYDKNLTVFLYNCDNPKYRITMTLRQFLKCKHVVLADDVDAEFILFPPGSIRAHRRITDYMLSRANMSAVILKGNVHCRLDVCRESTRKDGNRTFMRNTLAIPRLTEREGLAVSGRQRSMIVEYVAQTMAGDCGAPLCIAEARHYEQKCYVGFHVAGTAGYTHRYGYATYITRENAEEARQVLDADDDHFAQDAASRGITVVDVEPEEQSALVKDGGLVDGSFLLLGKVQPSLSMGTKTALRPTSMRHERVFGPAPTAPAILTPVTGDDGEIIFPMIRGLQAYQSPHEYREVQHIDGIVDLATRKHREATKDAPRNIFTPEEAVVGIEGFKIKPINRTTSAGYPYRANGSIGKRTFFGNEAEYELTSQEWCDLRERALYVVQQAKLGNRLCHIFTDFLKDELRPLAKVKAVATRVISGAPLDYVVAVRMYFGAFLAAMFESHTASGMAPGINPYTDWHRLATNLLSRGTKVFGGDFSRFDASEQPYIHYKILEYINAWYARFGERNAEDDKVRSILWQELVHSRHLTGLGNTLCYLVQWNKSLPSGHPLTTPVNSLYSLITLTACYVRATGDMTQMWERAWITTFGDDNINAVSDTVAEVFNQVTVSKMMHEMFGLTYTSDKKGAELVPYEDITQVTFLKRTFRRDERDGDGGWVGPLAIESILYPLYYTRNKRDPEGAMLQDLQKSLGELALHDATVWQTHFPKIIWWSEVVDFRPVLPFTSREAARDWVESLLDEWY